MKDPTLFDTDGPTEHVNVNDFDDVLGRMMHTDGMEFGFQIIKRDPRPDHTFSKEAVETLRDNMTAWVWSRIMRKFNLTGLGARRMQVTVTVSLDGEKPWPQDTVPFLTWEALVPDDAHKTTRRKKK